MRNPLYFFLLAAITFALGAVGARMVEKKAKEERQLTELPRFSPSAFPLKNHPFTIIVVGFNNGGTVEKTLSSVFSQNYENCRLIYIDDASDDGSFDLARDFVVRDDSEMEITLVQNEERLGNLANIYRAIQECMDDEIVVILQEGDSLAHEWVLQRLNAYYADPELWIACSQSMDYPTFQKSAPLDCQEISRIKPTLGKHLRTFYAALFKKINEADFIYSGSFLRGASEFAYMTPMFEMGRDHFHFIPEVLNIHDQNGRQREDRETEMRSEKWVRALAPYAPIDSLKGEVCGE